MRVAEWMWVKATLSPTANLGRSVVRVSVVIGQVPSELPGTFDGFREDCEDRSSAGHESNLGATDSDDAVCRGGGVEV